jgi:hypothetical protein
VAARKKPGAGPGRPPGTPNKSTANAREAIARLVEGNMGRVQGWLDEIHAKDGPKAAMACFTDLIEYHVPKLARSEVEQHHDGKIEIVARWQQSTPK